jgi:hypothetical protein
MRVTYIGSDVPENDRAEMDQFGLHFVRDVPLEIADAGLVDRIRGNPFYRIEERKDGQPDGSAARGSGPPADRRLGRQRTR